MDENVQYKRFLSKAQDAAQFGKEAWEGQSTGEKLAVAPAMNCPEWIAEMGDSMAEAIERIGPTWLGYAPKIAKQIVINYEDLSELANKDEDMREAVRQTKDEKLAKEATVEPNSVLDFFTKLVFCNSAYGTREADLVFDLENVSLCSRHTIRANLRLRPEDGETIVKHITEVHREAWREEENKPADARLGETRPSRI
jgi:hypothetical protein